jgi:hypothetical protein
MKSSSSRIDAFRGATRTSACQRAARPTCTRSRSAQPPRASTLRLTASPRCAGSAWPGGHSRRDAAPPGWTTHAVILVKLGGFGYLLKDRMLEVVGFLAADERIAKGGSALDRQLVARLCQPGPTAIPSHC